MRRPRGFTMIELAIVMALSLILLGPVLALTLSAYREAAAIAGVADRKAEAESAAWKAFRRGPATLDPDNHGLSFADGSRISLEDGRLILQQGNARTLLAQVDDFTATRQGGLLTLHLAVGGHHFFFDRREERR